MPLTDILFSLSRKGLQEGAWGKYKDCSCKLQDHQRNSALNKAQEDRKATHCLWMTPNELGQGCLSRGNEFSPNHPEPAYQSPFSKLQFHRRLLYLSDTRADIWSSSLTFCCIFTATSNILLAFLITTTAHCLPGTLLIHCEEQCCSAGEQVVPIQIHWSNEMFFRHQSLGGEKSILLM